MIKIFIFQWCNMKLKITDVDSNLTQTHKHSKVPTFVAPCPWEPWGDCIDCIDCISLRVPRAPWEH